MTSATANKLSFYDQQPETANFLDDVIAGLGKKPKAIPPKFFYDKTGSRLFDAICETPEYYPTRTEMTILERHIDEIAELLGENCLLIEPGSGNSRKVRKILKEVKPHAYMPMDISGDYLRDIAQGLANDYPKTDLHAVCTDYTRPIELPYNPAGIRRVAFFPGSSIGNFEPKEAVTFLKNIAKMVRPMGGLLIGVDLKKAPALLNAAYNDAQGATAAFNLNLLRRLNHELGANFDLTHFQHHAFYNQNLGRIEMHLVSDRDQLLTVNAHRFNFRRNESIHTENSYKYSIEEFQHLAARAGFSPLRVWSDPDELFSVQYFTYN
jgi:dimethylhistidine N-methyltransferase